MDRNLKIGIVGLGLIGGSIFKALCALMCNVFGVSYSNSTIKKAKKYCKNVSKSLQNLKECDIIFVCSHMNKTIEVLDKLEEILPPETIVVDVCSLKAFLCKKKRKFVYIPSHPMAGTEFSGFENSFETLFQKAKWVLTPFKDTKKSDITKVMQVIETLGAEVVFATPEEHDEAVALISHMPMVVAQAMFKSAEDNNLAMKLASSGFRDATRLALSNVEMAQDMVELNSANIQKSLLKVYSSVGELLGENYSSQALEIKKRRSVMYVDGVNIL